jgi:protoporphyrinogen oxidase
MYDVAIVGGGPGGLATAYHLRHSGLSVILLEESAELGGRTRSVEIAGEWVNTGAMFVYRGTPSHELARELGTPLVPFRPSTFGVHVNGATVVSRDNDDLVERLPLTEASRSALRTYMQQAVEEYRNNTVDGQLAASSSRLADVTADEQLMTLPAEARAVIEAAIRGGSVAKASQLSARYALRYFASYVAHEQNNRLLAVDGMQSVPRALARRLPDVTMVLGSSVKSVTREEGGEWSLQVARQEAPDAHEWRVGSTRVRRSTVRARQVVMAVPAPVLETVCDLPGWKRHALAKVETPGSTTLSVVVDLAGLNGRAGGTDPVDASTRYDDWSFLATPGRVFDAIINPRPGRRDGRAQFVCYWNSAGFQPDAARHDPALTQQWLDDFLAVAPGLRGRVLGAHLQSWPHCFSLLTPARRGVLDVLRRPVHHTLHFVGDYCSETAGTHGAYAEARRVAGEVLGEDEAGQGTVGVRTAGPS